MNKTIELSTGKLIDLSRFVALIPDAETAENHQYSLFLEGYPQPINLNPLEASLIKKYLQVDSEKKHNGTWDREEQIRLNQPKLKKLKEIIERKKQEQPSAEKAAFFESFKKTMDAHRPEGQKPYEH
jgi:type II secretory pathway component PulJ